MGPPNRNQRVVSGNVTKVFGERNEFGLIDDEVFFQQINVTDGPAQVGQRVYAQCQYTESLAAIKWQATTLKILPSNIVPGAHQSVAPVINFDRPPPPLPSSSSHHMQNRPVYKPEHSEFEYPPHMRPNFNPIHQIPPMHPAHHGWPAAPVCNYVHTSDTHSQGFLHPFSEPPYPSSILNVPTERPPAHSSNVRKSRWGGSQASRLNTAQEDSTLTQQLPSDDRGIIPSAPYYELPAGLMVPLVRMSDTDYKPLDPKDLRLPHPTMPGERLLNAIEAFYAPPNRDRPRDADGWDRTRLDEFLRKKAEARRAQ